MENNNLEIMDEVKEVIVSNDVVKNSPSNTRNMVAGFGVGIVLGVMLYKKVFKPRLEAKLGMEEREVSQSSDMDK